MHFDRSLQVRFSHSDEILGFNGAAVAVVRERTKVMVSRNETHSKKWLKLFREHRRGRRQQPATENENSRHTNRKWNEIFLSSLTLVHICPVRRWLFCIDYKEYARLDMVCSIGPQCNALRCVCVCVPISCSWTVTFDFYGQTIACIRNVKYCILKL